MSLPLRFLRLLWKPLCRYNLGGCSEEKFLCKQIPTCANQQLYPATDRNRRRLWSRQLRGKTVYSIKPHFTRINAMLDASRRIDKVIWRQTAYSWTSCMWLCGMLFYICSYWTTPDLFLCRRNDTLWADEMKKVTLWIIIQKRIVAFTKKNIQKTDMPR